MVCGKRLRIGVSGATDQCEARATHATQSRTTSSYQRGLSRNSPYRSGRCPDWLKSKNMRRWTRRSLWSQPKPRRFATIFARYLELGSVRARQPNRCGGFLQAWCAGSSALRWCRRRPAALMPSPRRWPNTCDPIPYALETLAGWGGRIRTSASYANRRQDSNLCISESEFAKTLSLGGEIRTSASGNQICCTRCRAEWRCRRSNPATPAS
jgi:hypothetical protein